MIGDGVNKANKAMNANLAESFTKNLYLALFSRRAPNPWIANPIGINAAGATTRSNVLSISHRPDDLISRDDVQPGFSDDLLAEPALQAHDHRRRAADDLGAIGHRLLGMKRAVRACEALAEDFSLRVDQNGHLI